MLIDDNNDISVSSLQQSISGFIKYNVKYGKAWHAKQIALAIRWGSWEEAYNRVPRILCAMHYYNPGLKMVCGHRRDVFSRPVETCPLSCVLVVRANGTCIPVLSASRTC